jgi:succinoglycan biosynthesis transport protein ExoP
MAMEEAQKGGAPMYLGQYLHILRRRWLSVLITTLLILGLAALVTLMMPKKYTATTSLFFAVAGESASDLAQGSSFAERQMLSYARVATSPMVLAPVIQRLALPMTPTELGKSVEATVPVGTVILEIAATDRDRHRSAQIANAVGVELSNAAGRLTPERGDGTKAVQVTIVAAAEAPDAPSSPSLRLNLGVGLVLGLMGGLGVALLRNTLDTKIRSARDVRRLTDIPVLGAVAYDAQVPQHPLILRFAPSAAPSEAVRRLRTNLQSINGSERPKSLVITSSIRGEGRSTIAMNLAVSLADTGARIILIDADLRRPSIDEYMGIEGAVGLTTVLTGQVEIQDAIQPFDNSTLDVLPAGQVPPNPSELLGSAAMNTLLEGLQASYDMVLLDTPPLLPVTDGAVLSKMAGGVLVILGADRVRGPQLHETLESLQAAGAHVFGIVMNKVKRIEAGAYLYESSYALLERSRKRASGQPVYDLDGQLPVEAERAPQSRGKLGPRRSRK